MTLIEPLLPPLLSVVLATCILWVGLLADAPCSRDRGADRHFVLLTACLGALGVLLLSGLLRVLAILAPFRPPASIWLGEWVPASPIISLLGVGVVIIGSTAVAVRLLAGNVALACLLRRGRRADDERLLRLSRAVAGEVGVREARVVHSRACDSPIVSGVVRPVIVLPFDAPGWDEHRLRVVLLHEYAHLKRRDPLTHLLAQLLMVFFWWNPLFWRVWSRLGLTREIACDDVVVAHVVYADRYARVLLDFARRRRRLWATGYGIVPMAQRSTVPARVRRLYDSYSTPSRLSATRADVVVMMIATVLTFAAIDVYGRNIADSVITAVSPGPRD